VIWDGLRRDAEAVMARAGFDLRSADIDEKVFGNWVMRFERPTDRVEVRFVNDRGQVSADGSDLAARLNSGLERSSPDGFVARLEPLLRESA